MSRTNKLTALEWTGLILLVPITTILNGWVLSILWRWFVVTTLHAPSMGIAQSIGISFMVGALLPSSTGKEEDKELGDAVFKAFFRPFILLLFAWPIHLFVS